MTDVYEPREDSVLLLQSIDLPLEGKVLEIGVGSGFIIADIARSSPKIEGFGTDINLNALIRAMKETTGLAVELVLCDGASVFRKHVFDCTAFNPPYLQGVWEEDPAIFSNRNDISIPTMMLQDASRVTKPNHDVFFLVSSQTDSDGLLETARHSGELREVGRKKLFFEELTVYRVRLT